MARDDLDSLLELAPDPTLLVDRQLRVVAAGAPAARLFGRAREQLRALPLETLIPGGVLDPEQKLSAVRGDGAELPIEISVRVLDRPDGPLLAIAVRDVTERRRFAATLREESERFKRLFEDGPVAMALVGEDFRLAEVNDAFCQLTGYSAEELAGLTFSDITHPDDVDIGVRLASRSFAGELDEGFSFDKRYVRKNGEVVWIELSVSPIRDEDGRLLKSLGLMQDITERRRALAVAHEQLERLERDRDRILESAGEGIYHVDEHGLITFANPAAAELLGWPPEALVGKPAHEVLHHTRADGGRYPRDDCPIHQPGAERSVEHVTDDLFWRRDGSSFPVHYTSAPVREPGAGGAVVVFSDVSERVRMETALRDARERAARERLAAAEAERARWARELHDETLQGLAAVHVLLSSGIRAAAVGDMRGRMRLAQEQIESELDKLRGLISDLRPAALDELGLEASVRDLAERTQVVYGIEVETTLALRPRLGEAVRPASEVETAAYRITQECLSNAARHGRASRVAVELAETDGSLHVRIRDDGRGFDVGDETRGFGLRGMRERVDLLDGSLAIESSADGTEVTASLPLAPA